MKFEYRPCFTLDQNDLQDYRRPRRAPDSLAFPSVHASARHDGRRLYPAIEMPRGAMSDLSPFLGEQRTTFAHCELFRV